jgi:lipopolysaccharide/colanic/teichoic acid biosynthesis glycosyltransferase
MGGVEAHPYQTALRAQRVLRVLSFNVAPALAASLIAGRHLDDFGEAAVVFGCLLLASVLLERDRMPLHLMPLATMTIRTLAPILGLAGAVGIFALVGKPIPVSDLIGALIGAWFVTAFAAWITTRFAASRQVRVAMIGWPGLAVGMAYELKNAGIRSYEVVGWLAQEPPAAEPNHGPHWLGTLDDVREVVERHQIELLVHSSGGVDTSGNELHISRLDLFERVAETCLDLPVRMLEASQLYENLLGHVPLGQSTSAWFQYLLHPRYRAGWSLSKRVFDLLVGTLMLVVMFPILAAFAIAVKFADGGPIFYRQRRVGEGGREFDMIKLRSMREDSEDKGAQWSQGDDDRVTGVGAIMRRLHIDEMPQLWNVLRGEMTIVGPRPERRALIVSLERQLPYYDRRHLVKPGLAGWAQACCGYGGSEQGTSWKLCHDLYYLKYRSVYFDCLVLLENVRVSVSGVQFGLDAPAEQFILGNTHAP